MLKKKHLICSIVVSLFLISCGGGSGSDSRSSKASHKDSVSNISKPTDIKTLGLDAAGQYIEKKKKALKNISSAQLAILSGECSGKNIFSGKCIDNKFTRNVEIPEDNATKQIISGKILTDIKDARICLDINKDNMCGWNEPLTLSDAEGKFELKVDKDKDYKNLNIIALRGFDNKTYRDVKSVLMMKYPDGSFTDLEISPYSTLIVKNYGSDDPSFKTALGLDGANELTKYKNLVLFEKILDILLAPTNIQKSDKEIIDEKLKLYGEMPVKFKYTSSDMNVVLDSLTDTNQRKSVNALKQLRQKVINLTLTQDLKESYAIILNSKVLEAQNHFRKSDENLSLNLSDLNASDLKTNAIKIRLKEIGLENITNEMVNAVVSNNLKIRDLENIDMVANISALDPLEELLRKQENATSQLFLQSVLLTGSTLDIFYYTSGGLGLSESSKAKLKIKENVEKIYTIEGLSYKEVQSVSWDDTASKHTITFTTPPASKGDARRLHVNYLALEDTDGKFTPKKPQYAYIGSPRKIPATGQEKVWAKYDDGSYQYGMKPDYKKTSVGSDKVVNSTKTNLQFQDASYADGVNDNITYDEATAYCENLTYAEKSDWRMPNIKEMVSATSINLQAPGVFENYSDSEIFFTKNSWEGLLAGYVTGVSKYGEVATLIGNVDKNYPYTTKEKYSVRCVRNLDANKPSLFPDFAEDNIVVYKKDKLSYDPSTKLMYLDEPFTKEEVEAMLSIPVTKVEDINNTGKFGDLEYATKYCNDLNIKGVEGFKGWRLPNINEMFYLLNANGVATFQHQSASGRVYGGYITSSYSLKDGTKLPWVTGKHNFQRRMYNENAQGYFKCVRSMDDNDVLKLAREITHTDTPKNRSFQPVNNEVNISLPANVFQKIGYGSIKLIDHNATGIRNYKQYEISNIVPEGVGLNPTIKSVTLEGSEVCVPHVSSGEWWDTTGKRCENLGYFMIDLNKKLMSNRYGKTKLKAGKTYKVVLGTQTGSPDLTINLTIQPD